MKSIAGFPIRKGERVVGTLNAAFITPHHFTDDERDALLAFADQAALAIENAALYTQVEQRARGLGALDRVNLSISQSLDPKQLMTEALAAVEEVMQVSVCLITLVDETSGEPVVAAERGLPLSAIQEPGATHPPIDPGYAQRVLASGEPLVVRDASGDSRDASIRHDRIRALTTVPLKTKDRIFGVLQIGRHD